MSNKIKGILFIIISAFGFAVMSIFIRLSGDLPTVQKVFFRNIMTVFFSAGLIFYYKGSFWGSKDNRLLLLYRSILGISGMVLYFYAIDNSVLADANMLNKLSTFFLILFSFIFLKEHIKRYQTISIIIAFIGTLFIIKPAFQIEILPYIAALFSAIFAGAAYTLLRYLGGKESYYTITFFFSFFSIVILFPFFIYYFEPMTNMQLIYLLLAGTFASVGQYGITIAYKYAPAKEVSIFNYLNVVFVTIISFFVFAELPDIYSFIGYIIIFGSSLYIFNKNQKAD